MSRLFPVAAGATKNVQRRSGDALTPLSDFCYSLPGQRTIDIDQVGICHRCGQVIWVIEDFDTPTKDVSWSANIAMRLQVPFFALKSGRRDITHEGPVSIVVIRPNGTRKTWHPATWQTLKELCNHCLDIHTCGPKARREWINLT